jgi:RimJ/RimL family protein N-acetyltransferase
VYAFLPAEPWAAAAMGVVQPPVHAHWLELGWARRPQFRGLGYATEIGRAGLDDAFDVLGARAVVSRTALHNARSVG